MNVEPESKSKTNEYLKGIVANLPEKPGIYQYLNTEGTIIYVGKAKNLRKESILISAKSMSRERHEYWSAKFADIRIYRCQYGRRCVIAGE